MGTYEIVASPLVEDAGILGAASIIKERIGGELMKVKILVDSTADIPFSWMEKYDIDSIPLYVVWEDGKSEPDERKPEEIMNFTRE